MQHARNKELTMRSQYALRLSANAQCQNRAFLPEGYNKQVNGILVEQRPCAGLEGEGLLTFS